MSNEQKIRDFYRQIGQWQHEIENLEDMKEEVYNRIDELNERLAEEDNVMLAV